MPSNPDNSRISGYRIFREQTPSGDGSGDIATVLVSNHPGTRTTTSYSDTTVVSGRSYDYQIFAINTAPDRNGEGDRTARATVAVDSAPVFSSSTTFSAAENQTAVGTVMAADADGDAITGYALNTTGTGVGVDNALFAITNGGVLTFITAPDFETPNSAADSNVYMLTVTATSGTGVRVMMTTQDISVTVTDVADSPNAAPRRENAKHGHGFLVEPPPCCGNPQKVGKKKSCLKFARPKIK